MRRFRPLSVLSAILAVCLSLAAPVAAAPTAPTAPQGTSVTIAFEFSVPEHWRAVNSQEQDGVTVVSFLLDTKGSRAVAVYGNFGLTATELISRNVVAATDAGYKTVGTLTSPDHSFVSVRLRRTHKDTGVVDDAVIAARMSPDAPKAGLLMIGQWDIENGNAYASQLLAALREATMVKE